MNTEFQRNLSTHVSVLGWLYILGNIFFVILAVMIYFFLRGIGGVTGDEIAMRVLSLVGMFVLVVISALGIPGIIAGIGLLQRKRWGRIIALVVAFFSLLNIPLGTALGIYTFIVLLPEPAASHFE
jgi:hypothetical protein